MGSAPPRRRRGSRISPQQLCRSPMCLCAVLLLSIVPLRAGTDAGAPPLHERTARRTKAKPGNLRRKRFPTAPTSPFPLRSLALLDILNLDDIHHVSGTTACAQFCAVWARAVSAGWWWRRVGVPECVAQHDSHSHAVRTDTSIGISCTKIWFVLLLRNEAALEALWQDVWRRGS